MKRRNQQDSTNSHHLINHRSLIRSRVKSHLIKRAAQAVITSDINNLTKVKMTNNKIKQPMRRMATKITKQPMRMITLVEEKF